MNLSRPFIQRPVATTLLMVALLLAGVMAYRLLPVAALPQVDFPTIQVFTFYPGASPAVDGEFNHSTTGTPLRSDPGIEPDVVVEFGRLVGDHAAVLARDFDGRGGTGSAGRDRRRR